MKEYKYKINGKEYAVTINSINGNKADVTVNGVSYDVEMENQAPQATVSAQPVASVQAPKTDTPAPAVPARPTPASPATPGGSKTVTSPLPGIIIEINVKEGDQVKAGQQLAVLEAMKMENAIEAEVSGTVASILVNKGDSVLEGAPIITIK